MKRLRRIALLVAVLSAVVFGYGCGRAVKNSINTVTLPDCDEDPAYGFSFTLGLVAGEEMQSEEEWISKIDIAFDAPHGLMANSKDLSDEFTQPAGSAGILDLGEVAIDRVGEAPADGYAPTISMKQLVVGHTYSVRTADGKHYGLLHLLAVNAGKENAITFSWTYQKDGTRTF